jgi:hypothetical protein
MLVYWLFVTLLAPTAQIVGIQASVVLMVAVFAMVVRAAGEESLPPTHAPDREVAYARLAPSSSGSPVPRATSSSALRSAAPAAPRTTL